MSRVIKAGLIAIAIAVPADAAPWTRFAVPPSRLGTAIVDVGRQAHVTIGLIDPGLAGLPTRGVTGAMTVDRALATLLGGLPARAERIDAASWRIVRATPTSGAIAKPRPLPRSAAASPAAAPAEIIVTASKRATSLDRFAGTAYVLGDPLRDERLAAGSDAIVARLPTLSSTALGRGRNKLFIRGVADSSFNGPSQATVGQYFGDLRLNYNAPDPDLTLADIKRVEVIEGPQGTLYGAGSLGGIVQIVPREVLLDRTGGSIAGGVSIGAHGKPGSDIAAMINLPIATGVAGLRAVAYRSVDGGYIDDVGRGLSNVNRTVTTGGRATLRVTPGDGWIVDLTRIVQSIASDDGQYADRGFASLTRASHIAQPFDNDYALAGLTIAKDWGRVSFRSATGFIAQDVDSRYDFTPTSGAATLFDQDNRIRLLSSENRLSRADADGVGWLVGLSALLNDEQITRSFGPVATPIRILGVENSATNLAAYGELGIRILPALVATVGGRFDYAHLVGNALDRETAHVEEPRRDELGIRPSFALAWRPSSSATLFARYQEGFRPGGLAVSGKADALTVQRFHGDSIATAEIGTRLQDLWGARIDAAATASYAHWEDIQADLVDEAGLPFTDNIGSGRILGLEAQIGWRPVYGVLVEASLFLNKSRLTDPTVAVADADRSALPNIPKFGARAAVDFAIPLSDAIKLSGGATLRYVGASRLGIGPVLGIVQGRYVDTAANLRIGTDDLGMTLDMSNLLDSVGNRFALGNPFDVTNGTQIVPLRPRTIRIGFDARF